MKKKFAVLFAFIFIVASPLQAFGQYAILKQGGYAKVLRIIDGDSLEVSFIQDNSTALVRMIGVDAKGFNQAVSYLNSELMGRTVRLSFDANIRSPEGRWNLMYVYLNEVLINQVLLEKGYAVVNENHRFSAQFSSLTASEQTGQSKLLGLWTPDTKNIAASGSSYTYSADCVNINTATASQLQELLTDVNYTLARSIITYRNNNPFNTVKEIKFVDGFTKEIYEKNKDQMTVVTNVKRASSKELSTLESFTRSEVSDIIEYREDTGISKITELYSEGIISRSKFNLNEPFISAKDEYGTDYAEPEYVFNVNTTSAAGLVLTGLSESEADRLISYREYHPFRNFGEVSELLNLSDRERDHLEDNLKTATDSNYVKNDVVEEYININTATFQQFRDLGLSINEANRMTDKNKRMYTFAQIPIDSEKIREKGVLFTNINRTTAAELATLDSDMSSDIINDILRYTEDQPFGSMSEVRTFFVDKNKQSLYNSIRDFIVLR